MSEKSIKTLDYISNMKSYQHEKEKDILITQLKQELTKLLLEINRLSKENSDLKIKHSINHDIEMRLQTAEETIKNLREINLKLMYEHKNKESDLQKNIEKILLEKKKDKLKNEKNETLYRQKMLMANQIEMENKIYKEEIENIKKQMNIMEGKNKNIIGQLEINNLIKYDSLKKKILNNLNETKIKLANLNMKYMDNNNRAANLQNYQLIMELEAQKQQNELLIKENEELNKQIFEIKGELDIHQKVEVELAEKIKRYKNKIDLSNNKIIENKKLSNTSASITNKNKPKKDMDLICQKLKRIKYLYEDEKMKNKTKRNKNINSNSFHNKTQFDYSFIPTKNIFLREREKEKDYSELSVNSKIFSEDKYKKEINLIQDDIIPKFKNASNEKKYINLYDYLEKCLGNFYEEIKNNMKGRNKIKIDLEDIQKLKFHEFTRKEQYTLLILLMNHILPLIYVYFSSNSNNDIINNNLFKTDLNLNYKILNKIYGNSSNIIRRTFLGKDNKITVELCMNKLGDSLKRSNFSGLILDKKPKFLQ